MRLAGQLAILMQHAVHVLADGLGEAGGGDADERGMVLRGHIVQARRRFVSPPKMVLASLKPEAAMSMGSRKWLMM